MVVLCVASAGAEKTGNEAIDRGIALYDDLEYEKAIEALDRAVGAPSLSNPQKTEAYKHLALSYVALNRDAEARAAFKKLLVVNPGFELPQTESPRAVDLFAAAKKEVTGVLVIESASPAAPRAGESVVFSIAVTDASQLHAGVLVSHRVRGQRSYSQVRAQRTTVGRYSATIPGTYVDPAGLEYYVVAVSAAGDELAASGSADAPNLIVVDERGRGGATPLVKKWWFWGAIAGAVVVGTVVGIAASGGGGGDDDATVNITVNYTP